MIYERNVSYVIGHDPLFSTSEEADRQCSERSVFRVEEEPVFWKSLV